MTVEPARIAGPDRLARRRLMLVLLGLVRIGALVALSVFASRLATALLCLVVVVALVRVDRAQRRRADVEAELHRAQVFADSVVENIPSMVLVRDASDLRVVRINRAGELLLGVGREELIGRTHLDEFPLESADAWMSKYRQVIESGELLDVPAEWVVTTGGQEKILHTRRIPILGADGAAEYLVCIGHDVSEQHQANVEGDIARQVADAANVAKNDFLSRMSHELRTPLNAVLGFGQLLQMGSMVDDQRSSVDHIVSAGRHLLELIDEVLDLSRVESGELRLSLEPVSISDVIRDAVGMMEPLAAARQLEMTVDLATFEETHVRADRQRLKQALLNLIANAVKYNREGGQIRISCRTIADDDLRVTVEDTGMGITEADLDRLFVPFERLRATATDVEGTGLGLALTKQLVEAMAGVIGVTSTPGVGTSFWIDLPLVDAPATTIPDDSPHPADVSDLRSVAPRTVLYIEDNIANVKLLERLVATRPHVTLLVALNGGLGLQLARQHQPSLILLDLHLPDVSGDEILRTLRADESTRSIPVFVLSADASPRQVERLLAAGATGYLTKPFDVPLLLGLFDTGAALADDLVPGLSGNDPLDRVAINALHALGEMTTDGEIRLRELVEVYLRDAASRIGELRAAALGAEHGRLGDVAHSLAGSSANFGATALSGMCRGLSDDTRAEPVVDASRKVAEIATSFGGVERALRAEFLAPEAVVAS